jgi:acetyl-CoA C-acetyltransferase
MNKMPKRIFIAGYHQSAFGKLGAMTIPEMVEKALSGLCESARISLEQVDCASVACCLGPLLHSQCLVAGLVAQQKGMESKPIETVENACSSGGQAILSVVHKLLLGEGEVGIALGIEKMRDNEGKADGKLIGQVLGTASHPDDRPGKIFVFPHIFAEVMALYMKEWGVTERELAHVPVTFYDHAQFNPYAQMRGVKMTVEKVMTIEGPNRYIAEGLPLKTFECSQISDGYAAILLATEEGLNRLGVDKSKVAELVGFGQATDPLSTKVRDVLRPQGAYKAMRKAYEMAGVTVEDLSCAEVHDCFGIMGALAVEILGKVEPGQGVKYYVDGKARIDGGALPINTSGGLIAKGHPISATGIAMVGWNYWQMTGQAPKELQVKNPRYAGSFNIGGPICASVTTVVKAL